MIDTQVQREAQALYTLVAGGGLALAATTTGYRLVAMRSAAVRRLIDLTGQAPGPRCAVLAAAGALDDIATNLDPATRAWVATAAAKWPLGVMAPRNPRSPLLSRAEPFVVAQCSTDDSLAACFGLGSLVTAAAALAARHGHLLVGASAHRTGTGPNYRLEDVPVTMRRSVDLVCAAVPPLPAAAKRLAPTVLDLGTGVIVRRGAAADDIERAWMMRARHWPAATG